MKRCCYSSTISHFLLSPSENILGVLAANNEFSLEQTQRLAWNTQIKILKEIPRLYEDIFQKIQNALLFSICKLSYLIN